MADARRSCRVLATAPELVITLHSTDILVIKANGDVVLSTGGWKTYQTFTAMNAVLAAYAPGLSVLARGAVADGSWCVKRAPRGLGPPVVLDFSDGMTVSEGVQPELPSKLMNEYHAGGGTSGAGPLDH